MKEAKRFSISFSSFTTRLFLLIAGLTYIVAISAADPAPLVPVHQLATGTEVYNYVNFAWGKFNAGSGSYTYTYGMDFGQTLWGDYAVAANPQIALDLTTLKNAGVEGIRWFVIPDGRNLSFDAAGAPTGRGPGFRDDLWAAMDLLDARQMGAVFTFLDGNTWFNAPSVVSGISFGHAQVITDSGKRQALYTTVIIPLLQDLEAWRTARPGHAFPVTAIDLGNELEFGTDSYQHTGVSITDMKAYVRETAALVHQYLPGIPVTIGASSASTLVADWTDAALGVSAGQGMDCYGFHHYGSEPLQGPGNLKDQYRLDLLGKRTYLQEFPGRNAPLGGFEMYLAPIVGTRGGRVGEGWLSGSYLWSLNGANDGATPTDPVATLQAIKTWFANSFYMPDLAVLSFNYPSAPPLGGSVQFQATIANLGGVRANSQVTELWLDGVRLGSTILPVLAPGERITIALPFSPWIATVGAHDAWFKADAGDQITESREDNNVATGRLTIAGGSPDLLITSLTFPGGLTPGMAVQFSATVKNQGTSASASNLFELWLDGGQLASVITPTLAAGQSVTVTVPSTPWTATPGSHALWAKTDTWSHVVESNETNNVWTGTVTVANTAGTSIAGRVIAAATGQPLAGATVQLLVGSSIVATTSTSATGAYQFANVAAGSCTVRATKAGYKMGQRAMIVQSGQVYTNISLALKSL